MLGNYIILAFLRSCDEAIPDELYMRNACPEAEGILD